VNASEPDVSFANAVSSGSLPPRIRAVIIACVAGLAMSAVAHAETVVRDGPAPVFSLPSWSPLVKRVLPAVVNVAAEIPPEAAPTEGESPSEDSPGQGNKADTPFDDFLRHYFEQHGLPEGTPLSPGTKTATGGKMISVGSAFIIDPAGYIVTNNHVVARATKITVIFQDNSRHSATIVGADPKMDIALLKVSGKHNLPFLQWGDSNKVEVGDWVMTVGNPFGLGGTVTAGIVSALGRDLQQGPFDDFLQIDAPINRGSSGGPTFDTDGHVVGINAAIYSPNGGSIGIGFAIPSSVAKVIVQKLRDTGHADHSYLGLSIQSISPAIAHALHIEAENPLGLLVTEVAANGPAAKAGVQSGDIIKEADGHAVQVPHDISKFVVTAKVGDKLRITLDRNGKSQTLEMIVAQAPSGEQLVAVKRNQGGGVTETPPVMGIWLANLTSDLRRELHVATSVQGVVVGGVEANSTAAAIGLIPGDVVLSINRQAVTEPMDATRKLRAAADQGDVLILINRQGSAEFVVLPAESKTDAAP